MMKTPCLVINRAATILILLALSTFNVFSQKLPAVQNTGLLAPANIKIDGKATEWGDQFQAYNKAVNLWYTLANDDNNLYLCVQAKDPRVIEKILTVGLSLVINTDGKKSDKAKGNMVINYPVMEWRYVWGILRNAGDKANWGGLPPYIHFSQVLTRTDTTVIAANKGMVTYAKNIKVLGIKESADTLISVYNEEKIHVGTFFDNKGVYTYELAVPLQYLGLSANSNPAFAYGIRLDSWGNPFTSTYSIFDPITHQRGEQQAGDPDLNSDTFLWSDYPLEKRQ